MTSKTVAGARNELASLFARRRGDLFQGVGDWPISVRIAAPTEAEVMADVSGYESWRRDWERYSGQGQIAWQQRQWPRMGSHRIPQALMIASLTDLVEEVGASEQWSRYEQRRTELLGRWPQLEPTGWLRSNVQLLIDTPDDDFIRLRDVVAWGERSAPAGRYMRELPIAGIDSKWMERRKGVILGLLRAIGIDASGDAELEDVLGLKRIPQRVRLRVLCDQLANPFGGLDDFEIPLEQARCLSIAPEVVWIIENQPTFLALPNMRGAVAIAGMGQRVSVIETLPWLRQAAHVLYWGDLDTWGFSCLNTARKVCPSVASVLMDRRTWDDHIELCVDEDLKASPESSAEFLTAAEAAMLAHIREQRSLTKGRGRLEQERIPWAYALSRMRAAAIANLDDCR
jgi:hypothetical protein